MTLSGRSIIYGALLYLSDALGGFRAAALAQALLAATALVLAARSWRRALAAPPSGALDGALLAATVAITPAGYFAGYMMPDIFLPLGLLALCQLALLWPASPRPERIFWAVLLAAAMLVHTLHIVLAVAVFTGLLLARAPVARSGARTIAGLIALALAGQFGLHLLITRATGAAPVSVPFVTARLIADGPGHAYLEAHCPAAGFALCRHRARLGRNSDILLWSLDPAEGLFSAVPPAERRRIAAEDARFALAVLRDRPGAVTIATLRSIADQLSRTGLSEFNYGAIQRRSFAERLPPPVLARVERSSAWNSAMPVRAVEALTLPLLLASVVLIALALRNLGHQHRLFVAYAAALVGAILLNAILCGAISTPHDRYQMRLIWILPFFAVALWCATRPRPNKEPT